MILPNGHDDLVLHTDMGQGESVSVRRSFRSAKQMLEELERVEDERNRLRKAAKELLDAKGSLYEVVVDGKTTDELTENSIDVANMFAALKDELQSGHVDSRTGG